MPRYLLQVFFLWTMISSPGKNSIFSIINTKKQVSDVCYPHIGCFTQESPWTTFIRRLPPPQSPNDVQVKFYIMTRQSRYKSFKSWKVNVTEAFKPSHESLKKLDFRSSRPMTVFHIHGMFESDRKKWNKMKDLGNAYLSAQDVNIIFIGWDAHSFRKGYRQNVSNCRVVAAVSAKFIENLMEYEGLTPKKIHIIGFSLGAHVAGYIGKRVPGIYRITALDAAQPGFENADPNVRLHYTDAQHVDALHTNARSLLKVGVGYVSPIGDIDFYFNGGSQQPGCLKRNDNFSWTAPKQIMSTVMNSVSRCSHMRSLDYWVESIQNRSCTMWGTRNPLPNYIVTKETLDGFGITPRSYSATEQQEHLRNQCTLGNCLPVGLNTFKLNSRGIFYVATGRNQKSFCIPRDDFGNVEPRQNNQKRHYKKKDDPGRKTLFRFFHLS